VTDRANDRVRLIVDTGAGVYVVEGFRAESDFERACREEEQRRGGCAHVDPRIVAKLELYGD
jgi:hypothetical protein